MGIDKDAVDIWKFGRNRPDLTLDESMKAPMPTLTGAEEAERRAAIDKHNAELQSQILS